MFIVIACPGMAAMKLTYIQSKKETGEILHRKDIMNLEKIMQIFLSEDYALGQCLP